MVWREPYRSDALRVLKALIVVLPNPIGVGSSGSEHDEDDDPNELSCDTGIEYVDESTDDERPAEGEPGGEFDSGIVDEHAGEAASDSHVEAVVAVEDEDADWAEDGTEADSLTKKLRGPLLDMPEMPPVLVALAAKIGKLAPPSLVVASTETDGGGKHGLEPEPGRAASPNCILIYVSACAGVVPSRVRVYMVVVRVGGATRSRRGRRQHGARAPARTRVSRTGTLGRLASSGPRGGRRKRWLRSSQSPRSRCRLKPWTRSVWPT